MIKISNLFNKYLLGIDVKVEKHNGIKIEDYPDKSWYFIPFPSQKGHPFNNDNLATVNRHTFLEDPNFKIAKYNAESRWKSNENEIVRNISWRLHTALWTVNTGLKNINIDEEIFVECGTGKGYMAAGISSFFNWDQNKPFFYLIDSFKPTMPEENGLQNNNRKKLFVYADGDEEVKEYFSKYSKIKIIKGFLLSILNQLPKIKLLSFYTLISIVILRKNKR